MLFTVYSTKKKAKDRGEGKGRHCCLGHVLDCRTNHSILTNFFRRTSILVRWGLVWCEPDEHSFFKVSILSRGLYYIHSFLQNHPGGKYLVRQGIESITPSKRLVPSLLSLSFCYDLDHPVGVYSVQFTRAFISNGNKGKVGVGEGGQQRKSNQSRKR